MFRSNRREHKGASLKLATHNNSQLDVDPGKDSGIERALRLHLTYFERP
jgi:hypothetical protein